MTPYQMPLVLAFPGNEALADIIAETVGAERAAVSLHEFPDSETSVTVACTVAGRDVILACTLDHPNSKLVPLYLAASNLRELGARRLLLASPYLAYMRQDCRFHPGEGVSAAYIGAWLSTFLDGLVTVDPHLHRIRTLDQVYRIPTLVVHAAAPIGRWIRQNVKNPVVIGPDSESLQWVSEVARTTPCPCFTLDKVRHGDREVEIRLPDHIAPGDYTPVLVDDIVSSGRTMIAAAHQLRGAGFGQAVCVAVHALFPQAVSDELLNGDALRVVSCNTVPHPSNAIDLNHAFALAVRGLLHGDHPQLMQGEA